MNIFASKSLYILVILFLVGLGLFIFKELFVFFIPIILAYLVAKILRPLKDILNKKLRIPIQLATLVSMVVILTLLVISLYLVGHVVVSQVSSLAEDLPELGNTTYNAIISASEHVESFFDFTPPIFDDLFKNLVDFTISGIGNISKGVGLSLLNFITFLPSLFFYILIMLIATYYVSNDLDSIKEKTDQLLTRSTLINKIRNTFQNDIIFALVAYLKAQGILIIITFFILGIGLFIMGYKYFLLIALGIAILDALPIFGTGTVFGPWIVIELLNGHYRTAIFLGIIYIVATITRQIMQPKILSSQIGLNPLLTLISIYAGIRLFGVLGIILGPMLMILMISIIKTLKNTNIKMEFK